MKKKFIRSTLTALVVLSALTSGCASVAVKYDDLTQKTASAIGIPKDSFTISDRVDNGVKTSYMVKTTKGRQYSCYVTGGVGMVGSYISDAICTELSKDGNPASNTNETDNALLKAAKRAGY